MTKLVGGAAVLLVLVVGYLLVISPRMSQVDEVRSQTETAAQGNATVTASIRDLQEKEAGLDAQREVAASLARRFPPTAVQAELFADVRAAARAAGIPEDAAVTSLTPTPPAAAGSATAAGGATLPEAGAAPATGLATMDIVATVTGSLEQLYQFMAGLEDRDRSYLFETAGLDPAAEADGAAAAGYTLNLTGTMFLLPAVVDPDAPPAPTDPADPAADPAAAAPAGSTGAVVPAP
ncbi:type II secretion system protein M [Nocardioides litoris]|uniref:type II secretion system protein M n=1 Tax=Nocardioides litoris TaxID=1926648 RepID=UPI0011244DAB|nr:type II secretion system protein M [Nocardioides litoris]